MKQSRRAIDPFHELGGASFRLVSLSFGFAILAACGGGGATPGPVPNPFSTNVLVLEAGSPAADVSVSFNQGTHSVGRELPILQTASTDATGHVIFSNLPVSGPSCVSVTEFQTYYTCHKQPFPQEATISIPIVFP
jgi:hypothetical protein